MQCPSCGTEVDSGYSFCGNCGRPILQQNQFETDNRAALTGSGTLSASGSGNLTITGLTTTGDGSVGYFHDQFGNPRMVLGDAPWAITGNAGRWNGGGWQSDYATYLANRASQGFTIIYTKLLSSTQDGGVYDNGSTWDDVNPFKTTADPSSGMNEAYWERIDYMIASALSQGITMFLNIVGHNYDMSNGPLAGWTVAQYQDYGTLVGQRYGSAANIVWMNCDDYFGTYDTQVNALITSLRSAGAAQPLAIENMAESTSRRTLDTDTVLPLGSEDATFNWVYSYNVTYFGTEFAYEEPSPIPVIWGDGYFYENQNLPSEELLMRSLAWWALSSGARGIVTGSEAIWQWDSGSLAASSSEHWFTSVAGPIRAAYEALPGWNELVPDTSSELVTSGRGTHAKSYASGGNGGEYTGSTDSYVTASRTPDKGSGSSLAVIYMSHASTIGINEAMMAPGYVAYWMDPATGAKTSATTGSSYTSPATNSVGGPDWVLVLQAPTIVRPRTGLLMAAGII